jgi:hypothetical protein
VQAKFPLLLYDNYVSSQAAETVRVFVLKQKAKTFTTKARRTRSFQHTEFKQFFFVISATAPALLNHRDVVAAIAPSVEVNADFAWSKNLSLQSFVLSW